MKTRIAIIAACAATFALVWAVPAQAAYSGATETKCGQNYQRWLGASDQACHHQHQPLEHQNVGQYSGPQNGQRQQAV